jgi:hypothetical protein
MTRLIDINPKLDRAALAAEFAATGQLRIRDVLTEASARRLQLLLSEETPWCLAWQAGTAGPGQLVRAEQLAAMTDGAIDGIAARIKDAAAGHAYGFRYRSYPLVTAYLERWRPGSALEQLLEELNSAPVLDLMREVTAIPEIVKLDGQATLYAPGDFLWPHTDAEAARGRRVAYVLGMTLGDWQPQWGGYLNFFDGDWDVTRAIRPRFNCLNLFRVPQWHDVAEVTSGAPLARYAVTGWARDR